MRPSWRFVVRLCRCGVLVVAGLLITLPLTPSLHAAMHHKVLYRFTGGVDGAYPHARLLLDTSGRLYGIAQYGGDLSCPEYGVGCGVVFQLTPLPSGEWQETVLHAFHGGADGIGPAGNLVFDDKGNLYGTTFEGGTGTNCTRGCGIVFELSPQQDGTWSESIIYNFQRGTDGAYPEGVIFDARGNLYGVNGSENFDHSDIFELSPPRQKGEPWAEKTLYTTPFGVELSGYLVLGPKGRLYGTSNAGCCGAVFDLKHKGKSWQETDLFDFVGGRNGGDPHSGVIFDNKGHMYGTTAAGGNDWGVAFELKWVRGKWTQVILHEFCSRDNCVDGALPLAPLVFDQTGNLYGTTETGGVGFSCGPNADCGVVFELSLAKYGKWKQTVLYAFRGGLGGDTPLGPVTLDGKGNIFGTTGFGGTKSGQGFGTVFELTPLGRK